MSVKIISATLCTNEITVVWGVQFILQIRLSHGPVATLPPSSSSPFQIISEAQTVNGPVFNI